MGGDSLYLDLFSEVTDAVLIGTGQMNKQNSRQKKRSNLHGTNLTGKDRRSFFFRDISLQIKAINNMKTIQ